MFSARRLLLCLSVCFVIFAKNAFAKPQIYIGSPSSAAAAPYDFNYKVESPQTNTYFGQNEVGDIGGGKVGSYYVLLPDGQLMTVDYTADGQGYLPKISYQPGARLSSIRP